MEKKKKKKAKKDFIERAFSFKDKKEEMRFSAYYVNETYLYSIKEVLKNRNIKPSELAKKTYFTKSYVSQVLNGTRMINIPFIARIRNAFGIPLELVDTAKYNITLKVVGYSSNSPTITATQSIANMPIRSEREVEYSPGFEYKFNTIGGSTPKEIIDHQYCEQ